MPIFAPGVSSSFAPSLAVPRKGVETMVTNFAAGHGWTMDGTAASSNVNDTSDGPLSDRHLSLTTNGSGATARFTKTGLSVVLTDKLLRLWIKIDDPTNLNQVLLYFGNSSFTSFLNPKVYQGPASTAVHEFAGGKWVACDFDPTDSASVTGSPNLSSVSELRVAVTDNSSGAITFRLGGVATVPKATSIFANGVVSFTMDDGYDTQWSIAKPALSKYGYAATLFPIHGQLGKASYMTLAQVQYLHDALGWEVGFHATTNTVHDPTGAFTLLSAGQLESEFRTGKKWLSDNGFVNGRDLFAYPQGAYNATVLAEAKKVFSAARGALHQAPDETVPPAPGDHLYKLRVTSVANTLSIANYQAAVDSAYANKTWLIFMCHKMATPADTLTITAADFSTLVDYVQSKGIACLPMGEVLQRLA